MKRARAQRTHASTHTHLFPFPVFLDLCTHTGYFTPPFCRTEVETPQAFDPASFPSQHFGRLHTHFPCERSKCCGEIKQRGGFERGQHHNSHKPVRPEHFAR